MTTQNAIDLREALGAPFALPYPVATLGRALWLYLALIRVANHRGLAIRHAARLAQDLTVSETEIAIWLGRLVEAKLIRVLSPSPFFTIQLCFWSAKSPSVAKKPQQSPPRTPPAGSAAATAAIRKQQQGDRGPGEGEMLKAETIRVLGHPDTAAVQELLTQHPAAIVRKALAGVLATPAHRIRKSRVALFRFLLKKYSQEIDVRNL